MVAHSKSVMGWWYLKLETGSLAVFCIHYHPFICQFLLPFHVAFINPGRMWTFIMRVSFFLFRAKFPFSVVQGGVDGKLLRIEKIFCISLAVMRYPSRNRTQNLNKCQALCCWSTGTWRKGLVCWDQWRGSSRRRDGCWGTETMVGC